MALASIRHFTSDTQLGLWNITESPDELLASYPCLSVYREDIAKYHSDSRKKEYLAVRVLLVMMTGDGSLRITHDDNGRPLLSDGRNISISHTRGYATLILSDENAAVDIEYRSDRVARIAHKFIREDEKADDVISQLIHWSVKESVYKYFSADHLEYFDMRLHPLDRKEEGTVMVDNLKGGRTVAVRYEVTEDYVISFVYGK